MNNRNIYFIKDKNNNIHIKAGIKYNNDKYLIVTNTYLYDLNHKKMNLDQIIKYYENNKKLYNYILNPFTIIIFNKIKNKIEIIQDINGDVIPIYYYMNNKKIIITNKLSNILSYSESLFSINKSQIKKFLKKGYLPNKHTLIKNIYKVPNKFNLIINKEKIKFIKKKIKYDWNRYIIDDYILEFSKTIDTFSKNKKILSTLSNGYDSNFINSFLDKNNHVEAFSIGGMIGQDEAVKVRNNIKFYKNVNLNIGYVDMYTLDNYVEIVNILEGAIYEEGIFLQYELSKLIKSKNLNNAVLFAGEGSDQIFSYFYYNHIMDIVEKKPFFFLRRILRKKLKHYLYLPKEFLSYGILKKHGIFVNNINIISILPYLNRNIVNLAYKVKNKNIGNKNFHIEACNKIIDKRLLNRIQNIGGKTDPIALFENCSYFKEIELLVENSKYNILKIDKFVTWKYFDYLLKIMYLEIFEYLFIDKQSVISLQDFVNIRINKSNK